MRFILPILLTFLLTGLPALAQVGDLIWAEEFEDLDDWLILTGNGSWGWGNGELQCYGASNVDIAEIPGESGNTALRITARQESGPGIVDQWGQRPLVYVGAGLEPLLRDGRARHDRNAGARARSRSRRLAGRMASRRRQLRLAPLRRDGHDGDGGQDVVPRPARHPQRRRRVEHLDGQRCRRSQRHLLRRQRGHAGESQRSGQPVLGSGRRRLSPLLRPGRRARRALPDLPALLG